eukprot:Em0017g242a
MGCRPQDQEPLTSAVEEMERANTLTSSKNYAQAIAQELHMRKNVTATLLYTQTKYTCPPQNGIQSTQQQQAAASVINSGANMQQPSASQQPIQFQNIAGPGQVSFNGNPPPLYYGGNPYPHQGYFQDPTKMAYATLPMQPYPTSSMPPQLYGGNYIIPPQQPVMVIQQQPTSVPISTAVQTSSGDNYLTMSVLMTFLVLIIGGWPSLLCTISALMISYNAKDDEKRGNIAAARTKANISLGLNIAAVVFVVAMWSVVAIPVAVTVSAQTSAAQLPAISTPSTVHPTTSTPTPYCYSTQNPSDCSTQNCYYGSYTYYYYGYYYYYSYTYYYYSCLYSAYYSYSSYSYNSYSYYYYYSQYCYSPTYSLTCSYG